MQKTATDVLFGLRDRINESIQVIAEEWLTHGAPGDLEDTTDADTSLPSLRLYEASKVVIGAAGMLQAMLKDPKDYLMESASQVGFPRASGANQTYLHAPPRKFFESRALHAASMARIPNFLHEAAVNGRKDGLTADEIAAVTGYDARKCGMFLLHLS